MRDALGREINYMRVSVTDRCNLRCQYCMPRGAAFLPQGDILTCGELLRIAEQAVALGIDRFKVTGGEPLVRQGCVDLIRQLKNLPGVKQVTLTSNGTLLGGYVEELREAGLDGVNISLDTLSEAQYRRLTGIGELPVPVWPVLLQRCVQSGLQTRVNAVLLQETREEWPRLAALAEALPVDVRFIELMPIGEGSRSLGAASAELLACLKQRWPALAPAADVRGNGPARYYAAPGLTGHIGVIDAISHRFCEGCNRVRLTSTGQLKPCLCYDASTDLRTPLRSGATGPELRQLIRDTILSKPQAHCFADREHVGRECGMNQIGG